MPANGNKSTKKNAVSGGKDANLDQVRNLLFGEVVGQTDARITKLENLLLSALDELEDQTEKRIQSLEARFDGRLQTIARRLQEESSERRKAGKDTKKCASDDAQQLGKEIDALSKSVKTELKNVRGEIHGASEKLGKDLAKGINAQESARVEAFEDLEDAKADRQALSELFASVALSLKE